VPREQAICFSFELLPDTARCDSCSAAGEGLPLEQEDIPDAELSEVIGDGAACYSSSDDDYIGARGVHHERLRAVHT
jgi:hypothetical protein